MAPTTRLLFASALLVLLLLASSARARPGGQDTCLEWPTHGSDISSPGPFSLSLSGSAATTWSAAAPVTVTLAGSGFTGFVAIALRGGAAAASWTSSSAAGALSPADGASRPMRSCSGGVTQSDGSGKSRASFSWSPPAAGSGTVTLLATVVVSSTVNYEVRVQLAELAGPSASASLTPAASPSDSPASRT